MANVPDDVWMGPYLTPTKDLDRGSIERISQSIFRIVREEDGACVQAAMLNVLFVIWEYSQVTQEQARAVFDDWIPMHLSRRAQ